MKASAKQWTVVVALSMMLGWAPTLAGQVTSLQAGGRSTSTGVSTQDKNSSVARLVLNGKDTAGQKTSAYRTALHNARKALAGGNLEQARTFVAQAKTFKADPSHRDTPANVERLIVRHKQMESLLSSQDPSYNQKTAEFLVQQSWELAQYGDWQYAQQLVNNAIAFKADHSKSAIKPDQVLAKIRQLRSVPQVSGQLKAKAMGLMAKMQSALDQNRLRDAAEFSRQLSEMNLADSMFKPGEPRPWRLALKLEEKLRDHSVKPATFNAGNDSSQVVAASATRQQEISRSAITCYLEGVRAIERNDRQTALSFFNQAWAKRSELDRDIQAALERQMASLRGQVPRGIPAIAASTRLGSTQDRPAGTLGGDDQIIVQKLRSHVIRKRALAERLRKESKVQEAMNELKKLRAEVEGSDANPAPKTQLIRMVDREIKDLGAYMNAHRSEIQNQSQNAMVLDQIARDRQQQFNDEQKIKNLVDQFNTLMKEKRFSEAEAIARQAKDINEREPAVIAMLKQAKVAGTLHRQEISDERRADANLAAWRDVEENAYIPSTDFSYGDSFDTLSQRRLAAETQRSISDPVSHSLLMQLRNNRVQPNFKGTSLADAVSLLGKQTGLNILLDPKGLENANVDSASPVDFALNSPITLESALKEIGGQKGLYILIENGVVKLTDKSSSRKMIQKHEYVGDLVTPIPNFAANSPVQMMLGTGIVAGQTPYANMQPGIGNTIGALAPGQQGAVASNPLALAQNAAMAQGDVSFANALPRNAGSPRLRDPNSALGGGTQADFQSLIDLIQTTISPEIWEDDGSASITQYSNTNSLVIRAPQSVHDEIQRLLKRLRELQDVQIVIETRFITLQDNFFERIGVDFDFQIDDNSGFTSNTIGNLDDAPPSTVVGRNPDGPNGLTFPTDLDIPFSQGSFTSAVPQFGGFDAGTAANFGFAILSDIEVFFLLQAAKGDTRSNVMLAPKITLFNGQQGQITDTVNRNFVTSVTPVVGSFAAAQAPVITTLSEGTMLNVTAVTSKDRRYVRMTLVPTFTQIRGVDTFTFSGRTEVDSGTNVFDPQRGVFQNNVTRTTEGVSVQLPQFAVTQISATVAVPDGGTILLGGVKRLNEARTERGVPFLSNIPYINRLFKNTGIGRETSSLMMMVTPHVIIKEEQEQDQVGGG